MRIGLIVLFLTVFLAACGSKPVRMEFIRPSAELLADCPSTESEIRVNGDLARAVLAGREDLANCNVDKKALRAFYDGAEQALKKH